MTEEEPAAAAGNPQVQRLDVTPCANPVATVSHASGSPGRYRRPGRVLLLGRLTLGLLAVLTMLGGPAAMAAEQTRQPAARSAPAVRAPAAVANAAGTRPVAPVAARSVHARPVRPRATRPTVLRTRLQAILDAQAAALLRGDEAAFLAPADPADAALLGDLRRRYAVLRAMRVSGWTETLAGDPQPADGGWRVPVKVGYCFVVARCQPVAVPVQTRWADSAGRPAMTAFDSSEAADLGPRPWEVSDLVVATGPRTVVAAPPEYADRMPAYLAAAENAAAVADRFARWGAPPSRYIVYLAGPDEWGHWYGVHQAEWVAGYAMPITGHDTEIVLNAQRVAGGEVEDTLRHEFAHVVTLADVTRDYSGQWWLIEGLAEYVRMSGRPLRDYELLGPTTRYVRTGNAVDVAGLAEPAAAASTEDAGGRYGVAFLTVRALADRYGEDATLRFFADVVRQGTPPDQAAAKEFGARWADVDADCARYVRRELGQSDG